MYTIRIFHVYFATQLLLSNAVNQLESESGLIAEYKILCGPHAIVRICQCASSCLAFGKADRNNASTLVWKGVFQGIAHQFVEDQSKWNCGIE